MKQLITIKEHEGRKVVSAREVHEFLGVKTHITTWMQRCIDKYDFLENLDFSVLKTVENHSTGATTKTDYIVTLDMAKELCMISDTKKGKEARKYFVECEKELQGIKPKLPQTYAEALLEAGRLALEVEKMELELTAAKPKIEFHDAINDTEGKISFEKFSKILGIKGLGRNNLFKRMREEKYLRANNLPFQQYVDSGLFFIREYVDGYGDPRTQTLITGKGQIYFTKKYKEE